MHRNQVPTILASTFTTIDAAWAKPWIRHTPWIWTAQEMIHLVHHAQRAGVDKGSPWQDWWLPAQRPPRPWDDPLTLEGFKQVRNLARRLNVSRQGGSANSQSAKIRRVVCSPSLRCVQTAIVLAEVHGAIVEVDPALCEQLRRKWFGKVEGGAEAVLRQPHKGSYEYDDAYAFPGGTLSTKEIFCCRRSDTTGQHEVDSTLQWRKGGKVILPAVSEENSLGPVPNKYEEQQDLLLRVDTAVRCLRRRLDSHDGLVLVTHGSWLRALLNVLGMEDVGDAIDGGVEGAGWVSFLSPCASAILELAGNLEEDSSSPGPRSLRGASLVQPFILPIEFTVGQDWCRGQLPVWKKLVAPAVLQQVAKKPCIPGVLGTKKSFNVLEIGSWEGLSASWWLRNLCTQEESKLWLVDHFDSNRGPGRERRRKLEFNLRLTGSRHRVRVLPFFSLQAFCQHILPSGTTFDFVYIDGDHNTMATLEDCLMAWQVLNEGGYMLLDDYEMPARSEQCPHNPVSMDAPDHPKRGIDTFLSVAREEIEIVHKGYQVFVRKTIPQRYNFPSPQEETIPVVLAGDELFAKELAVALCSLIDTCSRPLDLRIIVIDIGLTQESRCKLNEMLGSVSLEWVDGPGWRDGVPLCELDSDHLWPMGGQYAKLALGEVLPTSMPKVLYLDADVIVRKDVCALWDSREPQSALAAVRDFGCPCGVQGYRDGVYHHGLASDSYFNAGVLIIDMHTFREETERMRDLAFMFTPDNLPLMDQDILNSVFHGRWTSLSAKWNVQGAGTYLAFRGGDNPGSLVQPALFTTAELKEISTNPGIVHLTGGGKVNLLELGNPYCPIPLKPRTGLSDNPWAKSWFEILDKTPWAGWRPSRKALIEDITEQVEGLVDTRWPEWMSCGDKREETTQAASNDKS
ncbi:unnamed protein product [Choristocarpus tenellus]